MSSTEQEIRDRISQNDVTVARSYLEVDFMEWLSDEEIPFGYEPFTIPSVVGPTKDEWDVMVDAIRAVGMDNFGAYDKMTEGTRWEDMRPAELLSMWNDIYDKHRLQEEKITVEVKRSLSEFNKVLMLPDFALYMDYDGKVAGEDFDWSSYDYIIEVSGLWGVGLPGEATESDWWSWYRVSAVAFKELVYKLLGLWDDVYWVVPFEPHIPGVTDGIPKPIRDDDHYVVANITRSDLGIDRLADRIGITTENLDAKLSPAITPTRYDRPSDDVPEELNRTRFEWEEINLGNTNRNENAVVVADDIIVYHGYMGEVYVTPDSAHVRESQWRNFNMILLREYVLDVIRLLEDDGIVSGVRRIQ